MNKLKTVVALACWIAVALFVAWAWGHAVHRHLEVTYVDKSTFTMVCSAGFTLFKR